jgi:thiamine pyrophosphate-dependent acetolactate synthase large subunit-like protein
VTSAGGQSSAAPSGTGQSAAGLSVADLVSETLLSAGSHTVFGLPGTHNMAFWAAPPELATPRLVNVRHEQTAVYAADGLARGSGRLGAALVTTGPGAANALAAFGEAAMSGSPVLLIASEVPHYLVQAGMKRTLHQSKDQASMFSSLAKAIFTPRSPDVVARDLSSAIAIALDPPRGPVYMDIPADILRGPAAPVRPPPPSFTPPSADEDALAEAAVLINAGRSVAIWAGGGVVDAGADAALAALSAHLQAPVFTTLGSRGLLGPNDPGSVGLPPHEPEVEDLLARADVLLAVGTNFDAMMTKNATLRLPGAIIDVNVDLERARFGYKGVLPVRGDAKLAIEILLQETKKRDEGLIAELPSLQARVWGRLRADPRTAEACIFVASVERAASGTALVINDMTIPGYWLAHYYRPDRSRNVQNPLGWGTLGYALPASVGAAFASDRPVLAVCGDGGFMFAVGELATIAQEQLPVTILVVDDGGYGMLRFNGQEVEKSRPGTNLATPDFVQLAQAFGLPATRVRHVGPPLEEAVRGALGRGGPEVVVCEASLFPPKSTSPRWAETSG